MNYGFSKRVQGLKPSAIREIFKYSADPAYIPLSAGNPAPDAFPTKAIGEITGDILADAPVAALQYSLTEGYPALRSRMEADLKTRKQSFRQGDALLVTSGAQQVMDLLTKSLIDPGDVVICEAPSFIGSLNTFRSYEARLVGVEMADDGVKLDQLEAVLKREKKAKYFYTIPNFQNPSGITMSLAKRKAVYGLCKQYGVLILEDDPYGDLRFRGEDLPTIKSLDEDDIVVYAGSFSKVIAPGLRVGYAAGPEEVIHKMVVCKQGEDVHTNILAQMICCEFLSRYDYEAHLQGLRKIYARKAQVLETAMEAHFTPRGITWRPFDGGLFAWCTLPAGVDMLAYCNRALQEKVCVVPGVAFLTDDAAPCSSFRINFSTPTDEQLQTGIERLGALLT